MAEKDKKNINNLNSNTSNSNNNNNNYQEKSYIPTSLDLTKFMPLIEECKSKSQSFQDGLSTSVKNMIVPEDSNFYIPQNILNHKTPFPSVPPNLNLELFEKFNEDTLMFIFFDQSHTQAKYYAGKQLTKKGWMFHKKFNTFFEPIKPLKVQNEEYIEGRFRYWDYETWTAIDKKSFKFETNQWDKFE